MSSETRESTKFVGWKNGVFASVPKNSSNPRFVGSSARADGAAMDYGALEEEIAQQMAELRSQAQQVLLRTQSAQPLRKESL